ncbi:MAG: 50S ribosomal protein L4 [Patescibacteria group bacterium]|nr:50S ribosomal protein L4 [Patescibacteria group bacterium]
MAKKISNTEKKTKTAAAKNGLTVPVVNLKGEETGVLNLPKEIVGLKVDRKLIAQAIRVYRFSQRKGTASTKTRSEISGGGRKPWKEKGTGRARQGSIRAPHWRGGGIVFGPKPRDFGLKLPEKMRRKAILNAWSIVFQNRLVEVLEDTDKLKGKTKEIFSLTGNTKKTLIVESQKNVKLGRAVKNIPGVCLKTFKTVNTYDLLNCRKVLLTKSAFLLLEPKGK